MGQLAPRSRRSTAGDMNEYSPPFLVGWFGRIVARLTEHQSGNDGLSTIFRAVLSV